MLGAATASRLLWREEVSEMRGMIGRAQVAWWVIVIAVIGFYVTGLVMTVFSPFQMWAFTAVVVLLVGLFVRHLGHLLADAPR
jgi:hypothetical protein